MSVTGGLRGVRRAMPGTERVLTGMSDIGVGTGIDTVATREDTRPMTAAILTIGALVPFTFALVGALSIDYGKRGGL